MKRDQFGCADGPRILIHRLQVQSNVVCAEADEQRNSRHCECGTGQHKSNRYHLNVPMTVGVKRRASSQVHPHVWCGSGSTNCIGTAGAEQ